MPDWILVHLLFICRGDEKMSFPDRIVRRNSFKDVVVRTDGDPSVLLMQQFEEANQTFKQITELIVCIASIVRMEGVAMRIERKSEKKDCARRVSSKIRIPKICDDILNLFNTGPVKVEPVSFFTRPRLCH